MENPQKTKLNIEQIRESLADKKGQEMWRGLGELAGTDEFQQFLNDEFPQIARPLNMKMDRRQFMTLSGASLALAGLSGCRFLPQDRIVPYVKAPENTVPGKALYYASTALFQGYGRGIVVESHEGRPTKIEGNPAHPASLGSTDAFAQGEILSLYDADRSKTVFGKGQPNSYDAFLAAARESLLKQKDKQGSGIRILTETVTSPTLYAQIQAFLALHPQAKWVQYDPISQDNVRQASQLAFGKVVNTVYQFDKAERILSIDSDFFANHPGSVRFSRDFSDKRRVTEERKEMNRLYAVECTPKLTGGMADHRFPERVSDMEAIVATIAAKVGVTGITPPPVTATWIDAVVEDLNENRGRSLVIAGEHLSPATQALVHAINAQLGAVGSTLVYTNPVEALPSQQTEDMRSLIADIQGQKVDVLLILGANPAYHAPVDLQFGANLVTVPFTVHLGLHRDETGFIADWHIPEAHFLEAWGDARAYDGTVSIVQPLINPIYEVSKSALELLAALQDKPATSEEAVRGYWKARLNITNFDKAWRKILNEGVVPATAEAPIVVALKPDFAPGISLQAIPSGNPQNIEVVFAPDPTVWDGRYANNGWLQELPKPMTKLTWDNAVLMSVATAKQLDVSNEDIVEVELGNRKVKGPVWLAFGHADNSITLHLGYGRIKGGAIAAGGKGIMPVNGWDGAGFDANQLRSTGALWVSTGVSIKKAGGTWKIATTENHNIIEETNGKDVDSTFKRDIIRLTTLEEYKQGKFGEPEEGPKPAGHGEGHHEKEEPVSMYPKVVGGREELGSIGGVDYDYKEYNAWAMSIDLNTCTGCNTCTIACQAENNIAIVGKDLVMRGREMHWIRIDRYYKGSLSNPQTYFQPVGCQMCELAPCEPVCPVAATVHSHDGLNQMVYNRCIGTKYCSNNCPYKVRRFNFLNYTDHTEEPYAVTMLARNPNVTMRARGVMEKCTYCVQRISAARIEAKKEGRPIKDGEVVSACQQACPTKSITFGDMNDPKSEIAKVKKQPQNYILLEELNTKPRTTYLTRLRNPNPKLGKES